MSEEVTTATIGTNVADMDRVDTLYHTYNALHYAFMRARAAAEQSGYTAGTREFIEYVVREVNRDSTVKTMESVQCLTQAPAFLIQAVAKVVEDFVNSDDYPYAEEITGNDVIMQSVLMPRLIAEWAKRSGRKPHEWPFNDSAVRSVWAGYRKVRAADEKPRLHRAVGLRPGEGVGSLVNARNPVTTVN